MQAYSEDLRRRVVAAVDGGISRSEAARRFSVGLATVKRWLRLRHQTGGLAPRPRPGRRSPAREALRAGLLAQLQTHPDATLDEHCRLWAAAGGAVVSPATMSRVITHDLGWTRKKSP